MKGEPRTVQAEHGVVCRMPGVFLGYFGWPTVARTDDGALWVASSGLRSRHVCPWGKTVVNVSRDDGRTWTRPRVIQDSPLDDRDAGILNLGGSRMLVSWFTSDTRIYFDKMRAGLGDEASRWEEAIAKMTDPVVRQWAGSWIILSEDAGTTWGEPIRVPVSTPHGPARLANGDLLYLGKPYRTWDDMHKAAITAARSSDGGRTWKTMGQVPLCPRTLSDSYHEPHVLELPSGKLLGVIRLQNADAPGGDVTQAGLIQFSTLQTESTDGGRTWSIPRSLGYGSPPHLMRHSSGALVLTYGYREPPFGQRVGFSFDEGQTWDWDWIIRDDGPDGDLGYPSTVELGDGSLFTVCYQKVAAGERCSLLWSKWRLPT